MLVLRLGGSGSQLLQQSIIELEDDDGLFVFFFY